MKVIDLRRDSSPQLLRSPPGEEPIAEVRRIIERVRQEGDAALVALTEEFDGVRLDAKGLRVDVGEIEEAVSSVSPALVQAMEEVHARIQAFAEEQLMRPWTKKIGGGEVGESVSAVPRAGIYVPGGRAVYPSTVLMCATPAAMAGVPEIVLCVPPATDGSVPKEILAAASLAGVKEVFRVGGAQAIAAMAFGTESISKAGVVVGPGNIYVALAKREVAGFVTIDSIAGPTEIAIVAGPETDSRVLAADLIAQAEHGPGGTFLVLSWSEDLIASVGEAIKTSLDEADAAEDLRTAVDSAFAGLVRDSDHAIDLVNRFAPEHLELIFEGARDKVSQVKSAGAIFVGPYSPVSVGDYLAGSNHVLPTGGTARWASGLRASVFQRASAVVSYDRNALIQALPHVLAFSRAEGLPNHARALEVRLSQDDGDSREIIEKR